MLYINHRLTPDLYPKRVYRQSDKFCRCCRTTPNIYWAQFTPMLVRELMECHNIGMLVLFHNAKRGYGVTICQAWADEGSWARTIEDIARVLEIPFIKRWIAQ